MQAQMLLGNIQLAMSVCEAYAGQQGVIRAVIDNPEKFLSYAQAVFGDQITLADLKNPDSKAVRYIAASNWATGEVDKLNIKVTRAKMQEQVAAVNEGRSSAVNVTDANWQGEDAVYAVGDGNYIFIIGKNGNYSVMYGPDTENIKALPNKEGSTTLSAAEVREFLKAVKNAPRTDAGTNAAMEGEAETKNSLGEKEIVVELETNAELEQLIANSNESRSKVLRQYLVQKFAGRIFTMSDGRQAIMDNTDAKELSKHAGPKKVVQLSNFEKLIEQAQYAGNDRNAQHKKFVEFHYYAITAKYQGEEIPLLINVGVAKNDGKSHIYAILERKKEAPTHYGVSGPVGNRIKSASSIDSVPQNGENVNSDTKNSLADEGENANTVGVTTEEKSEPRQGKKIPLSDEVKRTRERLLDEYDADVQDKARKLVKGIDKLSAERRIAIYETILSGKNIDADTLQAACVFESCRKGLFIYFNRKMAVSKEGFHSAFHNSNVRMIAVAEGVDGVRQTVAHEIFHDIRKTGAGKALEAYALQIGDIDEMLKTASKYGKYFAKIYGVQTFDEFLKENKYTVVSEALYAYDEKFAEQLKGQSLAEEVAAKVIGEKLGTKKFMQRIVSKRGGINAVLRVLGKLKAYLQNRKGGEYLAEIKRLENLFLKAAKAAEVARQMQEVARVAQREGGAPKFNIGKSFAEQVDDVISGKHNPVYDLYVSDTPRLLIALGFEDKPLLMRNSKVREILEKHNEMSVELLKRLPSAVKNPVMIVKSKTHPNKSVVVITDIVTSKGEMIVPIWVSQDGTYLDVQIGESVNISTNFVASAYGRDVKGLLEYALENDEVLYYAQDRKRVSSLLATRGLQLPARLSTTNSTISISQNEAESNTSDENSPETKFSLSDEEYLSAVDDTSKTRYNHYGWVRENDVLTSGAWRDFESKFAAVVTGQSKAPKTRSGEFMIAVNDPYDEGINKYIVYASGTMESPIVSRILEIDLDNETELDVQRRELYAIARRGLQPEIGGIFHLHAASDYGDQKIRQRNHSQSSGNYDQFRTERGRGRQTSDRIKRFQVNDDGSFTTVYADGHTETKFSISLDDDPAATPGRESAGETSKRNANARRWKVYERQEALDIVRGLLADEVYNAEGFTLKLSGKNESQIVDYLWRVLNAINTKAPASGAFCYSLSSKKFICSPSRVRLWQGIPRCS